MTFRKSYLSLAVGATLAGAAAAPMPASAVSLVVDGAGGAFSADDSGDFLAYPFYTVANGTRTSFSLTNTSDHAIAVKVRFREQQYSMDVWDTIVFLSPFDKWDFFVQQSPDDPNTPQVVIPATEETCTMIEPGGFPSKFRTSSFNGGSGVLNGPENGRWTVGHAEVVGMVVLDGAEYSAGGAELDLGEMTKVKNNVGDFGITGCSVLRDAFANNGNLNKVTFPGPASGSVLGQGPFHDVPNVLIGRYLIDGGENSGVEAGDAAIPVKDLFLRGFPVAQSPAACASARSRENPANGNDNPRCSSAYAWDQAQWDHPHLGDMVNLGFYDLDDLTEALALQGDWSNNAANMVGTDWIVSFWDKYVYLDFTNCLFNTDEKAWCDVTPPYRTGQPYELAALGFCGSLSPFNDDIGSVPRSTISCDEAPAACLDLAALGWDIDEQQAFTPVSPGNGLEICNEVNVLSFANYDPATDSFDLRPSLIQQQEDSGTPFARTVIAWNTLEDVRGWADLALKWPNMGALFPDEIYGAATYGAGFMIRNTVDATQNNASLTPLATDDGTDGPVVP
jgi:hypothetical protein